MRKGKGKKPMGRYRPASSTVINSNYLFGVQTTFPVSSSFDEDDEYVSVKVVKPELDEDVDTISGALMDDVCTRDEDFKPMNADVAFVKEVKLSEEFEDLNHHLQDTCSIQSVSTLQKIFDKHGDITKGSILKSVEAKTAILRLVVEVVEVLQAHIMDSIGAHQMENIQKWTDDAASVGFDVEWLQKRIKEIKAIFKYQEELKRYNEICEQINVAKRALQEMEAQQMVVKKHVDLMKGEMVRDDFCRSGFCNGLI